MSENLIYGADILAYGAVADGVTDCSDAFIKAIENGENLISVPFGNYILTKPLMLSSNTKIQLHPNATLVFDLDTNDAIITVKDASSVIITGGNWVSTGTCNAFFGFEGVSCIKISDCNISGAKGVKLTECEDVSIKNVSFDIDAECILMRGETEKVTIMNITSGTSVSVIDIDEDAEVESLFVNGVSISDCNHFLSVYEGKLENAKFFDIDGDFAESFVNVSKQGVIESMEFDGIDVYCSHFQKDGVYFDLCGNIEWMEISDFKRNAECEARPHIPTLILKPEADTTALIDGMLLDNVINARALSKTIKMTTARLTNPTNKFIYTLECGIDKGDALAIPVGDFDNLTIYEK